MDREPWKCIECEMVFKSKWPQCPNCDCETIWSSTKLVKEKLEKEEKERPPQMINKIDGTTVFLLYILSFFIPLAGFIVGAIYASKDEEHYKHIGKNCLIFSVLNIVLLIILAIAAGA